MSNNYQSRLGNANIDETNPIIKNSNQPILTDSAIGLVFKICVGITLLLSMVIVLVGNPHKLSNPIDPDGNPCGQDELLDYPYIYFVTPSKQYLHRTVCVKKCEELSSQPELGQELECYPNSVVKSCAFHISTQDRNEEVLIYDTKLYLNKICMPLNIVYFKLISEALEINKMDQIMSDIKVTFQYIITFACVAFALSYLTKFFIDKESLIPVAITSFFAISTAGFLILGALFLYRAIAILTTEKPNDGDVLADFGQLSKNVDKSNSSCTFNVGFSVFCFINCGLYIKQYIEYDHQSDEESHQIVRMRNKMLSLISNVIESQKLIYLPLVTFSVFILTFGLFCFVEINVFSIGSTKNDERGLPFDQFKTNPMAGLIGIIILLGFFWIFIFIIQVCEYIVYSLSLVEIRKRYENNGSKSNNEFLTILKDNLGIIFSYRIGTIAYCSILQFALYYPRAILEWVDTSYQRKIAIETQKSKNNLIHQNTNDIQVNHTPYMNIQKLISLWYKDSFIKSVQPYGFIYTIERQLSFLEAGNKMQTKIDQTSFWFEDMLDGGELFENQIKYSICFFVSLCFLLFINQFDKFSVSSVMVPLAFMTIVSYVISLLYVNMYGSIYSTFIIYYLEKEYSRDNEVKASSNTNQLHRFENFILRIVGNDDDDNNKNSNNNNNNRNLS